MTRTPSLIPKHYVERPSRRDSTAPLHQSERVLQSLRCFVKAVSLSRNLKTALPRVPCARLVRALSPCLTVSVALGPPGAFNGAFNGEIINLCHLSLLSPLSLSGRRRRHAALEHHLLTDQLRKWRWRRLRHRQSEVKAHPGGLEVHAGGHRQRQNLVLTQRL